MSLLAAVFNQYFSSGGKIQLDGSGNVGRKQGKGKEGMPEGNCEKFMKELRRPGGCEACRGIPLLLGDFWGAFFVGHRGSASTPSPLP